MEKNRFPVVSGQTREIEDPKTGSRVLYHAIFCPFSRKIRWGLLEKGIVVHLKEEKLWRPSEGLYAMNPEGGLPVLQDGHFVIVKSYPL
ncbi:MAG: glutathione S-transferase family protein, partial [Holosporales bacterium]